MREIVGVGEAAEEGGWFLNRDAFGWRLWREKTWARGQALRMSLSGSMSGQDLLGGGRKAALLILFPVRREWAKQLTTSMQPPAESVQSARTVGAYNRNVQLARTNGANSWRVKTARKNGAYRLNDS